MEPLVVDEDIDDKYNPSKWSLGLKGIARIQRCLHLYQAQNQWLNLPEPIREIFYGPDERQGLNFMRWSSEKQTQETILVFIHGGAWVEGDRHMHNFIAEGLHQFNISVITLGYRLAYPQSGLDHCVEDVVIGIQQVQKSFPSANLLLVGHSAGGHLLMAALPRLESMRGIRKVFCVSGIYSLEEVAHTSVGVKVNFSRDQIDKYSISPHPNYDLVNLHLVVGQYDPPAFRKQAERFAARMQRKGFSRKRVQVLPNEDHFSLVENLFHKKAALTLYLAGVYNPWRSKL